MEVSASRKLLAALMFKFPDQSAHAEAGKVRRYILEVLRGFCQLLSCLRALNFTVDMGGVLQHHMYV